MDGIRQACLAKWGKVPLLETYRQMAIRQQKAHNYSEGALLLGRWLAVRYAALTSSRRGFRVAVAAMKQSRSKLAALRLPCPPATVSISVRLPDWARLAAAWSTGAQKQPGVRRYLLFPRYIAASCPTRCLRAARTTKNSPTTFSSWDRPRISAKPARA
jgi:hypothetical protein